ncbi:oligosaccharide flippase family protein [Micromonospora sp. DR5-3]|uniref:lipopolysaccharide biosynthesis protein n=1 Tax=unclassified Micromonospora TaxID=2617518 RepID=UPI0011D31075|nr:MULTISPECIES: oligosaccharide flippase family protein [unclassified Micromonospora]MCW3815474.1 oligosaccharide flippase family protein [Micromonospora sp. DR5-3]TYC24285.1 oligosaccharide flippase family protein [Micromonospora sp. MP36]
MSPSAVELRTGDPARPRRARNRLVTMLVHLGMLGLSQVGVTIAAFGTQILLARSLSQAAFGTFTTALALISLTAPLAVFGVSELWLQQFGQQGTGAYRWVRPALRAVAGCCALIVAAVLLWGVVALPDSRTATVRVLLAAVVLAQAALGLVASVQQLRGDYRGLSALQLAPHLGRVAVVLGVWAFGLGVVAAAAGYAAVALLTVLASLLVMRPFIRGTMPLEGHPRPAGPAPAAQPVAVRAVLGAALPFVLGNVFYLLGMYLGTVVAGEFLSPEAAALLSVPMSVLAAVYLVPRVVYQQYFLAKLHRWAGSDRDAILLAYRYGGAGMVVLGAAVAAMVAVAAGPVLPLLLGPEYADSADVLAVLALAIPFRFGGAAVASLLTSGGLLRRKVAYQGAGAAVYLAALAVATPLWGIMGAATATVVAEVALCCLFWVAVRRRVVRDAALPSWRDVRRRLTREGSRAS